MGLPEREGRPVTSGPAESTSTAIKAAGSSVATATDSIGDGRVSRSVEVEFVTRSCALVRGYGTREMLTELRGRAPVWSSRGRAWSVQPVTARDLLAVAQARGIQTVVTEPGQERHDPAGGRR
jgi:hypothetical protein